MTASILQQLLALCFAVIYSGQLSSCEKPLVGKKSSSIYLKDFTDLGFFFFGKCLFTLSVTQSVCCTLSSQPFFLFVFFLAQRQLNMILTNFEDLNSISNIFQETNDSLVLTDPVIIYIYLRITGRRFRDQGNIRYPASKLLK